MSLPHYDPSQQTKESTRRLQLSSFTYGTVHLHFPSKAESQPESLTRFLNPVVQGEV